MSKHKTADFTWGVLTGMLCLLLLLVGMLYSRYESEEGFQAGLSVSPSQFGSVAAAVKAYDESRGRRPERLEMLVVDGLLSIHDLVDKDRGRDVPKLDPATGQFSSPVDVVYFPAVRAGDPPDLLVLCTLLVRKEGDKFLAAYNDGRIVQVSAGELTQALQRTYDYLGQQMDTPEPTTQDGAPPAP